MTKAEMRELIEALADEVKGYVDERLAALPEPQPGKDGKDADPLTMKAAFESWLHALPLPKDGAPGKDADAEAITKAVLAALPPPAKGEPGKDADPERVQEMVDVAIAAIPRPRDGQDGKSVTIEDVLPALEASAVKALEALQAKWALEYERRASDQVQRFLDAIPKPRDGVDGMGIEDLELEHDGDGLVTFRFRRGELSREFNLRFPRLKEMGVFREGQQYREGDGVTFGGSFWIAQKDNPPGKPGDPDSGWRLAVKKGRDGKDGSPPAPNGPVRVR